MDFINEEDDVSFRLLNFVDNGLQTFFKFAFVFGMPATSAPISRGVDLFVLQVLGTSPRKIRWASPHDGRFTGTRFTDKNRVVLGNAGSESAGHAVSSSRPMTGSSLPLRAASFRLMAYFFQ